MEQVFHHGDELQQIADHFYHMADGMFTEG